MFGIVSPAFLPHFLLYLLAYQVVSSQDFDYSSPSEVLMTGDRIRGARSRLDRDFVLGGLFPIHAGAEGGGACGEVRLERGLERMEAMLFAIDKINNDSSLLPSLTLGYDIRDTCSSENIGLDETVDLIITSSQLDIQSCQSTINMAAGNDSNTSSGFLPAPTSGLVGAASSRVSVPVASLARLFTTPQISYASSSAILSNRDRYEYFYRTIPPDNLQARAMIDVLLHFKWTYISTIYDVNPYGEPGINEIRMLAAERGICIDLDVGIEDDFEEEDFIALARRLVESEANVVILFTSQDNAEELLELISAYPNASQRFTWIASDAWARSISVVHQFNATAAGLFGFAPLTEHLAPFQRYFSQLTVDSNQRNPWFSEFYEAVANCSLNGTSVGLESCNTSMAVTELARYEQGNFIPLVVDSIYTYAHALQNFLYENCNQPLRWFPENRTCENQTRPLTGAALLEYIGQVDFVSLTRNRVLFDNEGNVEGQYEILNYQVLDGDRRQGGGGGVGGGGGGEGREFAFVRVGTWDSSVVNDSDQQALSLDPNVPPQHGLTNNTASDIIRDAPISQCGRCREGQYRRLVQSSCCGICEPCLGQNYSSGPTATGCGLCPEESWGNDPLTGSSDCVVLQESFLAFDHAYSILIMIIAIIGLGCVVFTAVVFGIFWTTPVVKSSGREQMILLLIGITVSFISAFFYVSPPLPAICGFQRSLVWISFSVMFGALLIKIVRVARIFLRKNSIARPRFTEPVYQVVFTLVLVFLQMLIVTISLSVQNPEVQRSVRLVTDDPNRTPVVVVTCVQDSIVFLVLSVGYETILIAICTLLGALSFSYPENFNEAKYVAFASLSTLVIWIALIITYFATMSMQEFQNIAVSLAVVMTGYAVLLCLFGPKLFIILLQPKRNTKEFSKHSTVTKDLNEYPLSLRGGLDAGNRVSLAVGTPVLARKEQGMRKSGAGVVFGGVVQLCF